MVRSDAGRDVATVGDDESGGDVAVLEDPGHSVSVHDSTFEDDVAVTEAWGRTGP